ncbi:MAG: UDP-N-acetylenolpyruvoylglucosamine reductase [Patescibacteria group bacterium]|nr:UDP-N-acetylenolpyruvoylglucosamine reductase [Patescibacteria group bacterium]
MYFKHNVTLAPYTTFKIGGRAKLFIEVNDPIELAEALETAAREKTPVYVLGGGSNTLFSDNGFDGLVIRMTDGGILIKPEGKIVAGSGMPLRDILESAAENGFSGMETLAGIPGSFGGALRGNAGAFGNDIGRHIVSVKTFDQKTGMVKEVLAKDCEFGYRKSFFKEHPQTIILSAVIALTPNGVSTDMRRIMKETIAKREEKHSQTALCAGSFFMNPVVKDRELQKEFELEAKTECRDDKLPAGWLIDHVGLRGKTIGGAMVSNEHPNYIVNTGNAKAEDVVMLSSLIKTRVRDELGVMLQEEVNMVGF